MEMNDTDKIAYCGLFCGDCIIKDQEIGITSQKLLNVIRTPEFHKLSTGLPMISSDIWSELKQIQNIIPVLDAMCNLDCERMCKEGGGSSSCEIRICCKEKHLNGCWECDKINNCIVLNSIFPVHKGSNVQNMKIIREKGISTFISGKKYW